jgi:hypothetical protein
MIISRDAAFEWQRTIEELFDRGVADDSRSVSPSWVLVPTAAYVPGALSKYELRNEVLTPMIFQSKTDVQGIEFLLEERALQLKPDQELGVNITVVIGWNNGRVNEIDLPIFDGAPNLKNLDRRIIDHRKVIDKFNVLTTGNGCHFYAKDPGSGAKDLLDRGRSPSGFPSKDLLDRGWYVFRNVSAGYIRVSQNVKGPITRWTPEAE